MDSGMMDVGSFSVTKSQGTDCSSGDWGVLNPTNGKGNYATTTSHAKPQSLAAPQVLLGPYSRATV